MSKFAHSFLKICTKCHIKLHLKTLKYSPLPLRPLPQEGSLKQYSAPAVDNSFLCLCVLWSIPPDPINYILVSVFCGELLSKYSSTIIFLKGCYNKEIWPISFGQLKDQIKMDCRALIFQIKWMFQIMWSEHINVHSFIRIVQNVEWFVHSLYQKMKVASKFSINDVC